jgi:hypothetical protein
MKSELKIFRLSTEHVSCVTSASAALYMRSALFWDITPCILVIHYRRFGTTYRSYLVRLDLLSCKENWPSMLAFNRCHVQPYISIKMLISEE